MRALSTVLVLLAIAGQAAADRASHQGGVSWLAASVVVDLPKWGKPERKLIAEATSATCVVLEIAATKTDKPSVDPKLSKLKALGKAPFTAWNTFKLIAENKFTLQAGAQVSSSRAAGGTLGLLYKDKVAQRGGKDRLKLHVDLEDAAGKRFVNNDFTEVVGNPRAFATGEKVNGADYILVLTCSSP